MNQEKIGRFIAYCRKEKQLTQATLAEQLGIQTALYPSGRTGKVCRIL